MKICFIAPKAYQLFNSKIKSTFGGAEVQLSILAKEIARDKKFDVNFMVADFGQEKVELCDNVKVWKSINFKDNIFKQIYNFFKVFRKINADIYIQRTLTPQSGAISLYCMLKRKKFIYMVAHDNETDNTHELFKKRIKSFFAFLCFKFATKIIVQNNYEYNNLMKKYNANKIFILKKGIKFGDVVCNRQNRHGGIWVGRCEKWKRPELFINLVKVNKNYNFIMICPEATGKTDYFNEIKCKAEKLKNLLFVNFLENKEIYKKLAESKIFILTSEQEGDWPMTVLESASLKLPILTYDLNYEYLIDKYKGGFNCNGDFNLLNKKFNEILENKNLHKEMSEGAYKYIIENHDIKINVNKFLDIICQ